MAGQHFDNSEFMSIRMNRHDSTQSVQSVDSTHPETEENTLNQSIDLLAAPGNEDAPRGAGRAGDLNGTPQLEAGLIDEELLRRVMKRVLEPLMHEVKRIKTENYTMDKKLSQVLTQNDNLHKVVKELKAELNKGVEDLPNLLTGDGVQFLKKICIGNLDMKAKEESELELIQKFMDKAKEEGWLIKRSQKSEKDITSKYRDNRNYLKAQVRLRVAEDLTNNKTPISCSKLSKTAKFVREHLSVPELSNDVLLVLYNYAYSSLKYNNKAIDEETMSEAEKKIKEKAKKNIWVYTMDRVERDRKDKREANSIKDRICRLLESGVAFEPY